MPIHRTPPKVIVQTPILRRPPKPSSGGGVQSTKPEGVQSTKPEEPKVNDLCSCGEPLEDEDYDECRFCDQQRCDNEYEDGEIDEEGNPTNPDEELVKREVLLEDFRLIYLKKTNKIPSRNWKEGLVLMSKYDPDDENVSYTNDELELMGGYASDSSHESYHCDGIFSHFSKTTQLHSNFYREK